MNRLKQKQSYRLVFTESATGATREVAFDESGPAAAFHRAQRYCRDGEVQIFADGELLGRLRASNDGYWVVS